MTIEHIIKWGSDNPKKLFQIDGFGAVLSAVLLGVVLVKLEKYFGIPKPTLFLLASIPCLFALYDFYCFTSNDKNIATLLKGIAIANIVYSVLSIGLAIYHFNTITFLGWMYIIGEIMIVTAMAILELNVANRLVKIDSESRYK